jgi:methyl-accepting chemotaxis protein
MLQANEIQQRITHIQQTIGEAEQACMSAADTSPELKACIQKMADEAKQVETIIASNDQARIVQCVDGLEDMGDEARRMSRSDAHMSPQLETAITRVHAELSELKHKLH